MDTSSMEKGMTRPDKSRIAMGLLFVAAGAMPLLAVLGLLPVTQAPPDPAPSWILWVAGLMFVGAGLYVIQTAFTGDNPAGDTAEGRFALGFRELLVFFILAGFAAMFSWIAFGPGPRHFSGAIGFAGLFVSIPGDTIGRAAFGIGALLAWAMLAIFLVTTFRRR
jgi:hypothetical protein